MLRTACHVYEVKERTVIASMPDVRTKVYTLEKAKLTFPGY